MKVAIVGFGFMGMTHAVNILKNEKLELVAIVDKDLKGIENKLNSDTGNFAIGEIDPEDLSTINKYSELSECLAKESLHAVHVCVHTDLHFALGQKVLEKGLHLFLEKPMTLDVQKGQELIEQAQKQYCVFMVGHVVRFMSPYRKLLQWINDGPYGNLKFLTMSRFSGVPQWGQWKEKQKQFGSSGGALFDLLIHDIDFVHHVLGAPDTINSSTLPGALSTHDYVSAIWDYDRMGLKVKLEGGNTFHSTFPFQAGFMAEFEGASVLYNTMNPDIIQVATDETLQEIAAEDGTDGFYQEIDYFYQCIVNGEAPEECTPQSALETIKICYQHINS